MSRLVLGVVGHIDHGKTSLVRALTGMETDRLAEEKRRGISIALGFAHAEIGGTVDFVDAPGHERFVRTLVAGVTGVDAVMLVVAANEGVKPQTREHLTVAALLGVREALVVVTKADLVAEEAAQAAGEAARALAGELGLSAGGPIAVSTVSGAGIETLRAAIADLVARTPAAPDDGFAYLPVDRAFLLPGHGLVATGTLRRGELERESPLELLPLGRSLRIRGLQVHGKPVEAAAPGQRVAVNLRGAELDEVPRGSVLASAGALAAGDWLTVRLRAASDAPPLANGARLDLLIGASVAPVTVRLLDRDRLDPSDAAIAQLHARRPIAAPAGDGFVLRTPSPPATVAGGRVIDPQTRRLRRREPQRLERLAALAEADSEGRLGLVLADAGARGVTVRRLAQLGGISAERAAAVAGRLEGVQLKSGLVIPRAALARVQAQVLRELAAEPQPIPRQALLDRLPRAAPEVVEAVVAALAAGGRVRAEAGRVGLIRAAQDKAAAEAEAALGRKLEALARQGGLTPPELPAEARTPQGRRAIERLVRQGVLVRVVDRVQKREHIFHAEAIEAARKALWPRLAPPGLTVSEAGQLLGVTRKFSVPLLEHLDAIRFTRRVGDRRVLGAQVSAQA